MYIITYCRPIGYLVVMEANCIQKRHSPLSPVLSALHVRSVKRKVRGIIKYRFIVVVNCVQSEGPRHANGYEGLNIADMEPIQTHHPPDHYAGLDNQIHGTALDRHGYIEVITDPEYDGQPQVLCLPCSQPYHSG